MIYLFFLNINFSRAKDENDLLRPLIHRTKVSRFSLRDMVLLYICMAPTYKCDIAFFLCVSISNLYLLDILGQVKSAVIMYNKQKEQHASRFLPAQNLNLSYFPSLSHNKNEGAINQNRTLVSLNYDLIVFTLNHHLMN